MLRHAILVAATAALAGCEGQQDPGSVVDAYRGKLEERLETIRAFHDEVESAPRLTSDDVPALTPVPNSRLSARTGHAAYVETDHLFFTERRLQDFFVSIDTTITRVAMLLERGHLPHPNWNTRTEAIDAGVLRSYRSLGGKTRRAIQKLLKDPAAR